MLIQEKPLQHWIDNFYGYGSWQAKIWFVAYEETGGDLPEEAAGKFDYFYSEHQKAQPVLCDVRELYQHVPFRIENGPKAEWFTTRHDYRFGDHAVLSGVWKNLIAFTHGYHNKALPDLLEYQKNSFAQPSAKQEALIPLYPLPTHNHAWYYSWLDMPKLGFLKSRTQFQEHVYTSRIQTILQHIDTYKPRVVLMYAMNNINTLKQSVQTFFPSAQFKSVKAVKQVIPQHHIADINHTKLIITTQLPALRHGRIESGFDWEELGKMVKMEK